MRILTRAATALTIVSTLGLAGPAAGAATGPGDYPVHGVDTSRHNHPGNKPFDWKKLAASGQKFVSIKATQGSRTGYVDPWFIRDLAGARSVHMIHTAYHYFEHDQDGVAQADHFLRTVRRAGLTGAHRYELPLELDLEEIGRAHV